MDHVPFFPNDTDQCGPAALASVLNYWDKPTTPTELKSEVYLPHLKGTLPLDMLPAMEKHGLTGEVFSGSFDDIKNEIRNKRPVIAYLDFGTRKHPIGHFLVVTGFDEERKGLFVHSGLRKDKFATYRRFNRGWKDTDHWMMTVQPDDESIIKVISQRPPPQLHDRLSANDTFQLGQVYENQGLKKEAQEKYRAALKIDKNFKPALLALGNLAFTDNDFAHAKKYYQRVLKKDPNDGAANNNLAMIYLSDSNSLTKAEAYAKKATLTDTYRPYAYDTLAQIYMKQSQYSQALAALQEAKFAAAENGPLLEQIRITEEKLPNTQPNLNEAKIK